jgi:hypothetical protein
MRLSDRKKLQKIRIKGEDRPHWYAVTRDYVDDAADKYDLAEKLGEYIEYASDRLGPERILRIQLWWEEVQRANGFEPIARQNVSLFDLQHSRKG